ncbi:serine hydrolase [Cellulophaga sp. E16_2]|uniref:serine hydrolase n=1 Tax=Cellulophaga sp. E16_2 TaxID=2789297 RepID=UPI002103F160|nr:serine hydrolase [Cellulophaga sp. E16_2]
MTKIASIICLLMLFGCQSKQKSSNEPFEQLSKSVDQYATNILSRGNINSMSVAIYKNGSSYHNYYGTVDSVSKKPLTNQSLFEIASISKVFTGSLMAKAILDKKLTLDNDIREFLPRTYPNLEFEGTPVTIKNIVTHTLGFETPKKLKNLYSKIFSGEYAKNPIAYTLEDLFDELETTTLSHAPGTFYAYNNVGPEIAAYILEQVYKKPYPELLSDFFKEIGMKNTFLQDYEQHKDHLIHGYTESSELAMIGKNPLLGGASGIITTLPDLMKFLQYQLEAKQPFIKEATRTLFENKEEKLGYFWDVGYAEEEGFYYLKTGTSNGVQSILLVCPDANYGQILLMNNTSEKAVNDWISLYNKIEYDLIKFPKINLWSQVEPLFLKNSKEASKLYLALKNDTVHYFATANYLNRVGYDFLYQNQTATAIEVFKLAISTDPENANLYDSLGEAYYQAKQYKKAKESYENVLKLDPNNTNAEKNSNEINLILEHRN